MADDQASERPRVLSTVERAYELARNGPSTSVDDIRRQLEREGFASVSSHLGGPTLRRQLRQLCLDRRTARSAATEPAAEG